MSDAVSAIGAMTDGEYHLRGTSLAELIRGGDFISATWLAWTGSKPSDGVRKVLDACFIACIDHGVSPPSTHTAITVASCGKPMADAVAAGLLTLGPRHGNASGIASQWMREAVASGVSAQEFIAGVVAEKRRLPGVGHPEYNIDPRTTELARIAKAELSATPHLDFALEASRIFTEMKGKPLPLNIDGALGAIMADIGAPTELADAIFLAARVVGLTAHAMEESKGSLAYRRA